jgi:hypothetical protein
MVARILNLCGLELGPPEAIVQPGNDNPDGFWEHKELQDLNEGLLERLGGAWDRPADIRDFPPSETLDYAVRARAIAAEFKEPWGWKDPRNSILLPFWKQLYPGLRIVVCLRNPLDVVASLRRRNGFSYEISLALWYEYNRSIVTTTGSDERLVVHFDRFFSDGAKEIERLCHFCGLAPARHAAEEALGTIRSDRRHSALPPRTLLEADVHPVIRALYSGLSVEAGMAPVEPDNLPYPPWPTVPEGRLLNRAVVEARSFEQELLRTREALASCRSALGDAESEIAAIRLAHSDMERTLGSQTDEALAIRRELAQERDQNARLTAESAALRLQIGDLEHEVREAHANLGRRDLEDAERLSEVERRYSAERASLQLAFDEEKRLSEKDRAERQKIAEERQELERAVSHTRKELSQALEQLREAHRTLDEIASSRAWKLTSSWWRIAGAIRKR